MARTPERDGGFAPIEDYAIVGNKRTAALVAADGAIDWLCPQGFDRPSAFAALLSRGGGSITLAPEAPSMVERRYRPDTNVLETTFSTEHGAVRVTDAMCLPAAGALDYNQLVRRIDGLTGSVSMSWCVAPRFGDGRRAGQVGRRAGHAVIADGEHVLAVEAHHIGEVELCDDRVQGRYVCHGGDVGVLGLSSFDTGPLAFAGAGELVRRIESTAGHWERWLARCTYDGPWREAVLRSALALDLMVDAYSGAIVAAPTMGLPEQIGGQRNYDYRYAWLRDDSLTLEAMLRLGFTEQVHASLRWMFDATARTHPRLQPMYRLDGRLVPRAQALDLGGYRGSGPVLRGNGAAEQLQLGCFGDVLDMTWRYVQHGNGLADHVAVRLAELGDFVCLVWEQPDSGLWELAERRHYTQSKLGCELALQRAIQLATDGLVPDQNVARWKRAQDALRRYVHEHCWSESKQAYTRAAGSEELDAAVLLASRGSFLSDEPRRLSMTIDAVERELGAGGPLMYRYSGQRGQEGAFLACSFWAAEALARCGRLEEAEAKMDALVALGNDVGLYSEEIDPDTMGFRGNMPQALSHLALVNAADVIHTTRQSASPSRADDGHVAGLDTAERAEI